MYKRQGLDGADLVVGHHDADEGGVGADSSLDILRADVALRGGLDISDLEAQTLESGHAVHDLSLIHILVLCSQPQSGHWTLTVGSS